MRKSEVQSSKGKSKLHLHHGGDGAEPARVGEEQRRHMIAEAAYYRAEHRGFDGGDPLQDWLVAESEIDSMLHLGAEGSADETAAYERLREEVRKILAQMQDAVDAAALKGAFERGLAEAKRAESFSAEAMRKAAAAVREEMRRASDRMGPTWEHFSERSAGLFAVWSDRSRGFLSRAGHAVRDWLHPEHRGPEH